MKFNDVMIDIETLGNNANAAIIQIGACMFNLRTGEVGPKFQTLVKPDLEHADVSLNTICWWMAQDDKARNILRNCEHAPAEPAAIGALIAFVIDHASMDVCAWAMPPEFDLVILRSTADRRGLRVPWHFAMTRDLRTLEYLVGAEKKDRIKPEIPHDAGEDAKAQAETACKYYKRWMTRD